MQRCIYIHSDMFLLVVPTPLLTFMTVPTSTYIGTHTSLHCVTRLAPAVDSAVVVNSSWFRPDNSDSVRVEEVAVTRISSNLYQASIVFNPLISTDAGNYTCSVTVEAASMLINGTSVEGTYSLVTLGESHADNRATEISQVCDAHRCD